jgi:esterase
MKLFYRQFGSGKPLIILHGLFGLSDNWVSIGKILAQHYHIIIPDLRNHGQSPHSSFFNYDAMSADIADLMDELSFPSATVMGHSMGGKVAMQFALDYPENTDRLIVVDMSMRQYDERLQQIRIIKAMMSIDFDRIESRTEIGEILKHSITDEKVRMFIMKNLFRKPHAQLDWRPALNEIYHNLDYIFESITADGIYKGASLFITGDASDYVVESDKAQILNHFPKTIFSVIPNAGHWVHADNPEEFLMELFAFLGTTQE